MRIPVTTLDSFRLFRDFEFIEQSEMIDRINRVPTEPNQKMYLGAALHLVLEDPERFRDGHVFTVQPADFRGNFEPPAEIRFDMIGVHEILDSIPHGVVELKTEYEIGGVTLSGITDLILGTTIYDHKVSTRAPKPDNLAESYQWRCYLEMFSCDRFIYNCIQVKLNRKRGFYELLAINQFEHYRYPCMRDDIKQLIADFVAFAQLVGIDQSKAA